MSFLKTKITAAVFLFPVLLPVLFSVAFHIQQQLIQAKMKRRLEHDLIHSVTLSKKNIRWSRPGKELLIDGQYFDVKSITDNNDGTITVKGIYDNEETSLYRHLKDFAKHTRKAGNKLLAQLFHFLSGFNDNNNTLTTGRMASRNQYHRFATSIPPAAFTGNHTPPPRA